MHRINRVVLSSGLWVNQVMNAELQFSSFRGRCVAQPLQKWISGQWDVLTSRVRTWTGHVLEVPASVSSQNQM